MAVLSLAVAAGTNLTADTQQGSWPVTAASDVPGVDAQALAATVGWLLGQAAPDILADPTTPMWRAELTVHGAQEWIAVTTALHLGAGTTAMNTRLPPGSWNAIAATAVGDLRVLLERHTSPTEPPLSPPRLLSSLVALPPTGLAGHPIAIAAGGGVTILSADRLTRLGPEFQLTPATALPLARSVWPPSRTPLLGVSVLLDDRLAVWNSAGEVWVIDHLANRPADRAQLLELASPTSTPSGRETEASGSAVTLVGPDGTVVRLRAAAIEFVYPGRARIDLPPGSVAPTAAALDLRGNLWMLDPREQRIRVLASIQGVVQQVHAIVPSLPAGATHGVHALALGGDGTLLLGSRQAVWKLDPWGRMLWRIDQLRASPRQQLPLAFRIAVAPSDPGAVYLHDLTTGDLHLFGNAAPTAAQTAAASDATLLAAVAFEAALRNRAALLPEVAFELSAFARRLLEVQRANRPLDAQIASLLNEVDAEQDAMQAALGGASLTVSASQTSIYHPTLAHWYAAAPGERLPFSVAVAAPLGSGGIRTLALGFGGTDRPLIVNRGDAPAASASLAPAPRPPRRAATVTVPRAGQATVVLTRDNGEQEVTSAPVRFAPWQRMPEVLDQAASIELLRWGAAGAGSSIALAATLPAHPLDLLAALTVGAQLVPRATGARLQTADQTLASRVGGAEDWVAAIGAMGVRLGLQAKLIWHRGPLLVLTGDPAWSLGARRAYPDLLAAGGRQSRVLAGEAPPSEAAVLMPRADIEVAGAPRSPRAALDDWLSAGARHFTALLAGGEEEWQVYPFASSGADIGVPVSRGQATVPILPLVQLRAAATF